MKTGCQYEISSIEIRNLRYFCKVYEKTRDEANTICLCESRLGRDVAISIFPNFSYRPELHGRDCLTGYGEKNPSRKDGYSSGYEAKVSGA